MAIAKQFLETHPNWQIAKPAEDSPVFPYVTPEGWVEVLPHQHNMDGFFMVKLQATESK